MTIKDILARIEDQGGLKLGSFTLTLGLSSITTDESPTYVPIATANLKTRISERDLYFNAPISTLSTPKALQYTVSKAEALKAQALKNAISKANVRAEEWERQFPARTYLPLVIAPYLSSTRLDELQEQKCCGVDLCGNGVIVAEGILIYKTGEPNLYPNSGEIRNVYRQKTALIPQALILQPSFGAVKELVEFINSRSGKITFATVSKALKQLEEDLVIAREGKSVRQIQPEKILDSLSTNYRPPKITNSWLGRCNTANLAELTAPLQQAAVAQGKRFILTGTASANQYCTFGGEPIVSVYTDASIAPLLASTGEQYEEGKRFANLEIIQTFSDWVYFDPRDQAGLQTASPIQAYLELSNGDPRQQQAAEQIRQHILAKLSARSETP